MTIRRPYRVFLITVLVGLTILSMWPTISVRASDFVLVYVYYRSCTSVKITGLNDGGPPHKVTATVTSAAGTNSNSVDNVDYVFSLEVSPLSTTGTPPDGTLITVNVDDDEPAHLLTYSFRCSSGPAPSCVNSDNRLNSVCGDAAQPVAIYCDSDGSVTVYAVSIGKGYFAFTASPAEIAKVPVKPVKNTLIKQKLGAALYRLTSGELQVNRAEEGTGKLYAFIFKDCAIPK